MSGYDVDPGELQAAAACLAEAADDGRAELARLAGLAADVFSVGWRGGAATALHSGYAQWHEALTTMLAALDTLAESLGSSALGYARAEAANARAMQRLAS